MTPPTARFRLARAALLAACLLPAASGCRQKRQPAPHPVDPQQAARLGLTPDATDPTQRDKEAGYGRWRAKPEPVGTAGQLSPTRRRIDPAP